MAHRWLRKSKVIIVGPLLFALAFIISCGGTAAEPVVVEKQIIVEKEVIKEVPVDKIVVVKEEVVREVIKEVPVEVIKEVVVEREVIREVVVVATPIPVLKGKTFAFPSKPKWVSKGKYQPMVLNIVGRARGGQWDVHYCASLFSCLVEAAPKFNGLVQYDPVNTSEVIGDLARSWEVSEDGLTFTFRLHDAAWHDGQPVTAEDIVFTFDRITEEGAVRSRTAALRTFYKNGTATAIDPKTVKIPLTFPGATFLTNLAVDYFKMYPKHVVAGLSQDDANCCPENIIGSGPWKLKNWDRGTVREYERNTNYFKPDRPFFDGLKFFVIRDVNRIYAALQVEQAVTTEGPWGSSYRPEDMFRLQEETNGRLRARVLRGGSGTFFILHQNKPPFDDVRVRKAFALALDRQNVVDIGYCTEKYGCFASPATFFPRGTVKTESDMSQVPGYRYVDGRKDPRDLAEAKRLMADAGFPDGFKADLNMGNSKTSVRVAEIATEQLRRELGIDFTLKPVDTATYHVHTREGTSHATLVGGIGLLTRDPSDILIQVFYQNIEKNPDAWSDPRLDKLIDAQARELDGAKRAAMFEEMTEILRAGESQWVPNTWVDQGASIDYRLQNWNTPMSIQHLHKWEHVWWDPDAKCPDQAGC